MARAKASGVRAAEDRRPPRSYRRALLVLGLLAIGAPLATGQSIERIDWDEAERQIVRLRPATLEGVPAEVRESMESNGCLIPQNYHAVRAGKLSNVVQGMFARRGQRDWAFLCSKDGISSIRFHWGGPARCPQPIAAEADRRFLAGVGGNVAGFLRLLGAPSGEVVPAQEPGEEAHHAVVSSFEEKYSTAYYCEAGEWRSETDSRL